MADINHAGRGLATLFPAARAAPRSVPDLAAPVRKPNVNALTDHAQALLAAAITGGRPQPPEAVFLAPGTGGGAAGVTGEPGTETETGYARQRLEFAGGAARQGVCEARFPFARAAGELTHCGLFDAPVGGNALTWSHVVAIARTRRRARLRDADDGGGDGGCVGGGGRMIRSDQPSP